MDGLRQPVPLAIALTLCLTPALAWPPETRVRMVDEAVRFMPASLRTALESHREELLGGMLSPMVHEDGAGHRPPWSGGTLDATVGKESHALQAMLAKQTAFDEISRAFGSVAHYVVDAGFPPGATRIDGAKRYEHFAAFCEDRRERFPLVFYGHADAALESNDFRGFALQEMQRASEDDSRLARVYAAAGNPHDPAAFDDRSVPFAVGSLAYSRSITNIVRIWLSIWNGAGGDMGKTPYWPPPEGGDG